MIPFLHLKMHTIWNRQANVDVAMKKMMLDHTQEFPQVKWLFSGDNDHYLVVFIHATMGIQTYWACKFLSMGGGAISFRKNKKTTHGHSNGEMMIKHEVLGVLNYIRYNQEK